MGLYEAQKLFQTVRDHPVGQIVGRQRNGDPVAQDHTNAVLAHATTELRAHDRTSVRLHFELPAGEDVCDDAVELHMIIATQRRLLWKAPRLFGACIDKGFRPAFQPR